MREGTTTVQGNLCGDPIALRGGGARFRVASTPRFPNKSGEWVDGPALFVNVVCWDRMAMNVVASLRKGDRVIVYGPLKTNTWTDKDGNSRENVEMGADGVGASLAWNPVDVRRRRRDAAPAEQVDVPSAEQAPPDEQAPPEEDEYGVAMAG
ncbi:MAG: single-stranded DNA-binding protein [Mycobacteriales bacterium]